MFELFDQKANPFVRFRKGLTELSAESRAPGSALRSFTCAIVGGKVAMLEESGQVFVELVYAEFSRVGLDMQCQVWWRFLLYEEDPFSTLAAASPQISSHDAYQSFERTWGRHACCHMRGQKLSK